MSAFCTSPDCACTTPHTHCASCGIQNPVGLTLCPHHHVIGDEWAAANSTFCALIHRKIEPPPVVLTGVIVDSVGEDVAY